MKMGELECYGDLVKIVIMCVIKVVLDFKGIMNPGVVLKV